MYTNSTKNTSLSPRVLVADDEWYMSRTLETIYKREGYEVVLCEDGSEAAHKLVQCGPFDLVVLDDVMPKMSGLEVLRLARDTGITVPVIIVSGQVKESDRVKGLNMGADDYVVKPFSSRELMARTAAVRRRSETTRALPKRIRVGDVVADFESYEARRGDEEVHFTPMEWGVLRHMAYREGRAVSRPEFNVHVLKIPATIETRTIDRHAYALRCKIDENPKKPRHILAVNGVGYRLNEFELLA